MRDSLYGSIGDTPNLNIDRVRSFLENLKAILQAQLDVIPNIPGKVFVNDKKDPDEYYAMTEKSDRITFTEIDNQGRSFTLPTANVILGNSVASILDLPEPLTADYFDTPSRTVRIMLGASGSGKSYTTKKILQFLVKTAQNHNIPFQTKVRFSYGTAIIKNKKIKIETKKYTFDTEKYMSKKKTTYVGKFTQALTEGRFEDTNGTDGAVALLEKACRAGEIEEIGIIISQTEFNDSSSRGVIVWEIQVGKRVFIIIDAPGNESAFDLISTFFVYPQPVDKDLAVEHVLTSESFEALQIQHKSKFPKQTITANTRTISELKRRKRNMPADQITSKGGFIPEGDGLEEIFVYARNLCRETFLIRSLIASFTCLFDYGNNQSELKFTFPFINGNPGKDLELHCLENSTSSPQQAGIYYPFSMNPEESKRQHDPKGMHYMHNAMKQKMIENLKETNGKVETIYPLHFLTGYTGPNRDIQACIILSTTGQEYLRKAAQDSFRELISQVIGTM